MARCMEAAAWHAQQKRANPELYAAHCEALLEDYHRQVKAAQEGHSGSGRAMRRLVAMGCPQQALEALARGNLRPTLATRAATEWAAKGRLPFLVLLGQVGMGKTLAAALVALDYLRAHPGDNLPTSANPPDVALWVDAHELNRMGFPRPEDSAWFERLLRCGLLVLDDLGTESIGATRDTGVYRAVETVLCERHAARRKTVLTSNLSGLLFGKRYGARVSDRLEECGVLREVDGENQRHLLLVREEEKPK